MDRLIFRSIRLLVGGRVRAIMSGGAPLAPDTHDYLKSVLGCPILQVAFLVYDVSSQHIFISIISS